MSVTIFKRKFFIAVAVAITCCIISVLTFVNPTVSAAEKLSCYTYNVVYDYNADGVIDDIDITAMEKELLSGSDTSLNVSDIIHAYRISRVMAQETSDTTSKNITPWVTIYSASEREVCESNDWFFRNFLTSDFELTIYDESTCIVFEFTDETKSGYYKIVWDKQTNVVYNESVDYFIAANYENTHYEVFVRNNQYYLNVFERKLGPAIALTDFTKETPVTYEQTTIISDVFGPNYELIDVRAYPNYVDFMFSHHDGNADYIIRVPISEDAYSFSDVMASCYFRGANYTIYAQKTDDMYAMQVKVS